MHGPSFGAFGRAARLCWCTTAEQQSQDATLEELRPQGVHTIPDHGSSGALNGCASTMQDVEKGFSAGAAPELVVPSPYGDAVPLPSRESIDTVAADRQLARMASGISSTTSNESVDSASSHIKSWMSTHYNVGNDVVHRLEFISDHETKAALIGLWVIQALAFVGLIVGLTLKKTKSQHWFLSTHFQEICNVTLGLLCWVALAVAGGIYVYRLILANQSRKRWSIRRKRNSQKTMAEHGIVFVNITSWIIQNAYILGGKCRWFDGFVTINGTIQWSCWNAIFAVFLMHAHDSMPWVAANEKGQRPDAIIMDAPRIYHLPKLLFALGVEGMLVAIGVLAYQGGVNVSPERRAVSCRTLDYQCSVSAAESALISTVVACFIGYFFGVMWCLHQAYAALREKPYGSMRMANLNVRLQVRLRGLGMAFFILSTLLYIYVSYGTCVSYLQAWMGFLPMNVVMTGLACVSCYLWMPNNPKAELGLMHVWLQEFAWSEREVPARRVERRSGLSDNPAAERAMDLQPMFCFESSLKMLYWSMLVYRYDEEGEIGVVTREGAMALYKLDNFELMWEKTVDTKAIMAWNKDTVVVAFRGTASFRNVLTDIKAWYATHPPKRGKWWLGSRPFVHQGFLRSWEASGFCTRVVDRIHDIVSCLEGRGESVRVFVTGHSLGGALATLAAYDIQTACEHLPKVSLQVYTFGAPRVGNHAFAREMKHRVPELWNVINDQDTVPRSGKFAVMYKRPGQRVLISPVGDLVVRPSFVEAAAQRRATSSVAHHLLVNYQRAHIAVIKAQFTCKRLHDGMAGVLAVAEACGMQHLLRAAGVEYQDLRKLRRLGSSSTAALQGLTASSRKRLRKLSSKRSSLDFSFSEMAAIVGEEIDEAGESEEDIESPSDTPMRAESSHEQSIRRGVAELEAAPDDVRYAAAIAALEDGVRERPSEAEANAALAAGGDLDVDDGQLTHLRHAPMPSAASAAAHSSQHGPAAAAAVSSRPPCLAAFLADRDGNHRSNVGRGGGGGGGGHAAEETTASSAATPSGAGAGAAVSGPPCLRAYLAQQGDEGDSNHGSGGGGSTGKPLDEV